MRLPSRLPLVVAAALLWLWLGATDALAQTTGPTWRVEPAPAWLAPPPAATALAGAALQHKLIDQQIRVDAQGRVAQSIRWTRVAGDASGVAGAAAVEIGFDPTYQQLALHRIDVVRDGQRSSRLDATRIRVLQREPQLERQVYDGRSTLTLALDDVRVGDEVEVAYTILGANPVFGERVVQALSAGAPRMPTAMYRLRVLAPASRRIAHREPADTKVETRSLGDERETTFVRQNVAALGIEPGAPASALFADTIQLSEFADWGDVARWGMTLFDGAGGGPLLEERAAQIRASHSDPAQRLLAALEFVQREVRYLSVSIGTSSHRPAAPEVVLQRRYGDCKDKVALLVALLRRLDIPAQPVLVSQFFRAAVDDLLPSPLAFDHVVARVELGPQVLWLDGTRASQSGPLAARQPLELQRGLLLARDAKALVALPAPHEQLRMQVRETIRTARWAEPPELESRVTYRGELAELMRQLLVAQGPQGIANELSRRYLRLFPKAQLQGPAAVENATDDNAVTFQVRFTLPEFWRFADQRGLAAELLDWSLVEVLNAPRSESRRQAFGFAHPGVFRQVIELQFPEDVFREVPTRHVDEGDRQVALHVTVDGDARRLRHEAELRVAVDQIRAPDWPAYSARLPQLLRRLQASATVPVLTPAASEALAARLRELDERQHRADAKPPTRAQADAQARVLVAEAQLASDRLSPPMQAQVLRVRGVELTKLGRHDEARADFERARSLAAGTLELTLAMALNEFQAGRLLPAVDRASEALHEQPRLGDALFLRGLARYLIGDLDLARGDFESVIADRGARLAGAQLALGLLAQQRHDAAALKTPPDAATLPNAWPRPLIDLAWGAGDAEAALRAAREQPDPVSAQTSAHFVLGELERARGHADRARAAWQQAVDLGAVELPEHAAARMRLQGTAR